MSNYQCYGLVWLGRWTTQNVAPGEVHLVCEVSIDPHAHDHHQVYYSSLTSWNFNGQRIGDLSPDNKSYPEWQNKVGALKTIALDPQGWLSGYKTMTPEQIQNAIVTRARNPKINDRTAFVQVTLSPNLFTVDNPLPSRQRKTGPFDGTVNAVVLFTHESPAGVTPEDHWNVPTARYWEVFPLPENGNLAAIKDIIRMAPRLDKGLSLEDYLSAGDGPNRNPWGIRINVLPQINKSTIMYSWDDCPQVELHEFMSRMGGPLYVEVTVHELDIIRSPAASQEGDDEGSEPGAKHSRARGTRANAPKGKQAAKKTDVRQKSTSPRKKDGTSKKKTVAEPSRPVREGKRTASTKR